MKKIHLIGDSHTIMYKPLEPLIHTHHFGACTAYGLMNPDSETQGLQTLKLYMEEWDPKEHMIIFGFGEIDCRVLIYMKHMQRQIPLDIMVKIVLDRYFWAMDLALENRFDIAIHLPIPAVWQDNEYKVPFYADIETRGKISTMLHEELKYRCQKRGHAFYNPWRMLDGGRGIIHRDYLLKDLVHVDPNLCPIGEDFKKWLTKMSFI